MKKITNIGLALSASLFFMSAVQGQGEFVNLQDAPVFSGKDTIVKSDTVVKDSLTLADTTKKDSVKKVNPIVVGKIKPYEKVITKDFTTKEGLFTIHQSKDKIYFEVSDTLMHQAIMVINRLQRGPGGMQFYAGEELDEATIQFEKGVDDNIRIVYDMLISDADSTDAIYKAVKKSNLNPTAAVFPILAYGKQGGKSYVVDATSFLKGKSLVNDIRSSSALAKSINLGSAKDYEVESIHVYPINVEISVRKNYTTKAASGAPVGGTTMPASLVSNTSFIALPKEPMQRRYYDPRVGYFADYFYDYGDHQQKTEKRQFITRWRLEPKPADVARWKRGELVEPAKPIVIYIDPATPKQWRPYLIAGINDWQKAFEEAGFKNAIIGKEWPENDTTMHMDDARYSMINYLPSEISNAYGPQVHDPRSGEIIQTHIGWYHNVMELLHDWYMIQAGAVDPQARKAVFDEALMGQLIRFVSSHEIGHTLGLRHNFGSSSQTPVEKLRDKKYLDKHGHTASIMDYARFNYVAQPEDNIPQEDLFPRIGEYDKWAIKWGYKSSGAETADQDQKIVREWIVKETSKNPRLWFGNGEERRFDPRCQTEDLGDNAMKASTYGILNLKRILPQLPDWTYQEGDIDLNLNAAYKALQQQYFRYMGHVLKNVGGVEYTIKSVDQKGPVFVPTSIEKQHEALAFYDRELFTTPTWLLDPKITSRLNLPKGLNFVQDTQAKVLNSLLDKERLEKIDANNLQFGDQAISLEDYMEEIHQMVWRELKAAGSIQMDSYRRGLQKTYFGAITTLLASKDPAENETDVFSLAKADIDALKQEIADALPHASDRMTVIHLKDLQNRIKSIVNSKDNEVL